MRLRKYAIAISLPVKVTLIEDKLLVWKWPDKGVSALGEMVIFGPMIRALPNSLTLCNLIFGCCAIAALFEGMPRMTLIMAVLCLVMDLLDGFLARRLNVSSALGVQLDSLADLVSFGVLPGCVLYLFLNGSCSGGWNVTWLPFAAFIVTAGVALRLAKFNIDTRDRSVFHGLATPAAAAFLFGLLWMHIEGHQWWPGACNPFFQYTLILLLPFLMLSNLRLWSMKGIGHTHGKYILAAFITTFILLVFIVGSASVSMMVALYVAFGILNHFIKLY